MLPIAMALLQFAPTLAGLFGGPKAEDVAAHVVGIAKTVTGQSAPEAALAALQSDPNLALQFQKAVLEQQGKMAEIAADVTKAELAADTAAIAAVNATMQTEAKSEHWLQWSWRPLNGYALAIGSLSTVIAVLYLSYLGVVQKDASALNAIPTIVSSITMALGVPGAVCGVTAWYRGKMQNIQAAKSD